MNLSQGITKAYETKWCFANSFTVKFTFNEYTPYMRELESDDINVNILSITTPEFSNSPVELWIGNRWRIQNGRANLYRYSITFKDKDQMKLYRLWNALYSESGHQYFDAVSFTTNIFKDKDWLNEEQSETPLISLGQSIVESISQLTFNNDIQNQIAEFTVQIRCVAPLVNF